MSRPGAWVRRRRPSPAVPTGVIGAAAAVSLAWIIVFGLRRGPFWLLLPISLTMLALAVIETPPHPDLLLVHRGIILLGVGSGALLFVLFLLPLPLIHRMGRVHADALRVFGRPGTTRGPIALALFLILAAASEVFWRGFVQGRLAEEFGARRAFRLTLLGFITSQILTVNLAIIAGAIVTGTFWGWLRLRTRSIVPGAISHFVWAALMYIAFPI
jgi:membrane protease YdiL (CAAX protease family)